MSHMVMQLIGLSQQCRLQLEQLGRGQAHPSLAVFAQGNEFWRCFDLVIDLLKLLSVPGMTMDETCQVLVGEGGLLFRVRV